MPQFSPFLKCYMALNRTKFTKVRQSASNLTKCCSWTNVKAKWKTKSSTWILLNEVNEDQFWGTRKSNFNEFCLPTEYLNLFCETHRNEKKWNGVQHPMKKKIWIFIEKNALKWFRGIIMHFLSVSKTQENWIKYGGNSKFQLEK